MQGPRDKASSESCSWHVGIALHTLAKELVGVTDAHRARTRSGLIAREMAVDKLLDRFRAIG